MLELDNDDRHVVVTLAVVRTSKTLVQKLRGNLGERVGGLEPALDKPDDVCVLQFLKDPVAGEDEKVDVRDKRNGDKLGVGNDRLLLAGQPDLVLDGDVSDGP